MTSEFSEELMQLETTIEKLGQNIRSRVKKDWDCVVGLTGYEGSGKSSFSIQLAKQTDKSFVLSKQMIWSANEEQVKKLIRDLPKYSVIIGDEAIKLLHKQNWQSKLQKFLNMLFTVARDENKVVFLLMPRFIDFNEYFRNHRIFLWIHIVERGVGVLFKKEWSPFASEPWNVAYNDKLISSIPTRKTQMDLNQKIKILSRCKGFLGWFRFPDLDKETKKEYKHLKARNKYVIQQEEKGEDMKKDKIHSAVRIARLINKYCETTGAKPTQVCKDVADISPSIYRKYEQIREEHDKAKNEIVDKENQDYWNELKEKKVAEELSKDDAFDTEDID